MWTLFLAAFPSVTGARFGANSSSYVSIQAWVTGANVLSFRITSQYYSTGDYVSKLTLRLH